MLALKFQKHEISVAATFYKSWRNLVGLRSRVNLSQQKGGLFTLTAEKRAVYTYSKKEGCSHLQQKGVLFTLTAERRAVHTYSRKEGCSHLQQKGGLFTLTAERRAVHTAEGRAAHTSFFTVDTSSQIVVPF